MSGYLPSEVEEVGSSVPVKFYASSRCPYAQRVWIGLEEKAVEYQWIEVDLYRSNGDDCGRWLMPLEELQQRFPDFVACSPRGQLPALDHGGEQMYDSIVLLEYVHEVFGGPPLLPSSPYSRAKVRLWSKHVDLHIVPNYDRLLAAHGQETRKMAREDLLKAVAEFEAAMAPFAKGPFFLGEDFSMVDLVLAPWWQRMCTVLRAYRKFDPSEFSRLQLWFEAVEARPCFAKTAMDPEKLIEDFSYCADPDVEEGVHFRRGLRQGRIRTSTNQSSRGRFSLGTMSETSSQL